MSSLPSSVYRRQPLNCEPCRLRKIKCSRNGVPCDQCVKRGKASICVFKNANVAPVQQDVLEQARTEALEERVRQMEYFLQELMAQKSGNSTSETSSTSPVITTSSSSKSQYVTATGWQGQSSVDLWELRHGALKTFPSGHQKYQPYEPTFTMGEDAQTEWMIRAGSSNNIDAPRRAFPWQPRSMSSTSSLIFSLPPGQYCDFLKTLYLEVFSPLFHVLHEPTFANDYQRFQQRPESMPLSWLALLCSVFSVAILAVDEANPILDSLGRQGSVTANISHLSAYYRALAMECLEADHFFWQHNLHTLQALVLLIYGINQTHGQSWPLLGLAHNIAEAIGCHVDPAHFGLSTVACEERRRAWAALRMLYTFQSTTLGFLDSRCPADDVKLPADVNDEDLLQDHSTSNSGPTQMSYILCKFKLYKIAAEVCRVVFSSLPPTRAKTMELQRLIEQEQTYWRDTYLQHTQSSGLPVHHAMHLKILYSYSHQLSLILHRPLISSNNLQTNPEDFFQSRSHCINCALNNIKIHQELFESVDFKPYCWYTNGLGSFHAFHAAVFLATLLTGPRQAADPVATIQETLQECQTRFEKMASRSIVCQNAAPIIRSLINLASSGLPAEQYDSMSPLLGISSQHYNGTDSIQEKDSHKIPTQIEMAFSQLRPEQWINPSSLSWNSWDFLTTATTSEVPPVADGFI